MKQRILIILILVVLTQQFESSAQITESDLYRVAYNYLNDSIIKLKYPDAAVLAKNCNECCVKGRKLKFDSDLQVANRFIQNNQGFPISDLIERKYQFTNDCLRAIRMGTRDCELANHVQDSLATFWHEYERKDRNEILKPLEELISNRKDGYQVFFSDIYKNTLAAELKEFCSSYLGLWQGSSTSYFFIFNDEGEIEEIYSGVTIHYN